MVRFSYTKVATRPDLAFAVSTLGRFNAAPTKDQLGAAKKTLRYLRQTSEIGLTFGPGTAATDIVATDNVGYYNYVWEDDLVGYCDSDWAGDLDTRRSTTGYAFMLSKGAISWKSKRQPTVALSSTEAE